MNLPFVLTSSAGLVILLRWTALLALGWMVHGLLQNRHARWRLILWRSILCFSFVLPVLYFVRIPALKILIPDMPTHVAPFADSVVPSANPGSTHSDRAAFVATKPEQESPISRTATIVPSPPVRKHVLWRILLGVTWFVGFAIETFRLIRLQTQLSALRRNAKLASPDLQNLARKIQEQLKVEAKIELRISDSIASPFLCGSLKPIIMLPETLIQNLSSSEISTLLSHEIAHVHRHDLIWCVGWRWINAMGWFHPLTWGIPAAHNLACEQEADRIASCYLENRASYAQLLSQIALRVIAVPPVETRLVLNGASQIVRRLNHLGIEEARAWKWRHSVAGFGLAGLLFLMTAGWEFSRINAADSKNLPGRAFKEVLVVVQDEDGKPIEGAIIQPDGLRVKGLHSADAYHWTPNLFGPPPRVTTDREGKAHLKYPVVAFLEEKEFTGKLIFNVVHTDFSTVRIQEFSVNGTDNPIRMARGIPLEVAGYFGTDRKSVTELIPNVSEEGARPEDWKEKGNGILTYHKLSPGDHLFQLMGRLPSGEIIYSEGFEFVAERGKQYRFNLEMKPGIRLEGKIDEKVPRPIKDGRVLISVRPKQFPPYLVPEDVDDLWKKYGDFNSWKSFRPIAEDGTFVFESIPPGEVDVMVHGEGFVSKNGGQAKNRINSQLVTSPPIGVPQAFRLMAPITKIEVITEPTATLEVTTKTPSGKPIEGATAYVNPNVMRMSGIFGDMRHSDEKPFRYLKPLPPLPYSGITDENGLAIIRNLPAVTRFLDIEHPQFEVPVSHDKGDRTIRFSLLPGTTNKLEVTLQPKGKQFLGSVQ